MAITIDGTGSISGISVGGIPDGVVDTDVLAANAVTFGKIGTTEQSQLCKAWVNFDGTGTPAIRASYNVSSITDNGVGDYTVNFTSALVDANYASTGFAWASNKNACAIFLGPKVTTTNPQTTSSIRIATRDNISETTLFDADVVNVAIFR